MTQHFLHRRDVGSRRDGEGGGGMAAVFICCFECCYLKIIFFQDYFALSQKVSNFVGVYVK